MKLNQAGIDLIKHFEGCYLKAYPDPATNAEPITIGYGHTGGVKLGEVYTPSQAEQVLIDDLSKVCVEVKNLLKVELTDNQFSALIALVFNIGGTNFRKSTLLKLVNLKDPKAAGEFEKWNKAAGKVMAGLTRRRLAERDLFCK